MSQENVEVVRELYRAMNDRDPEGAAEYTHPGLEWVPDRRVGEGPFQGRESALRFFMDRAEMLDGYRVEVERTWEKDDQVLAYVRVTGSGKGSGAPFDIRIGHLWTVRDGVVVRGEGYGDREEALEAVGLSD